MYNIGIDLGGTFIKAGVVDQDNQIVAKFMMESRVDTNVDGLCARMVECAQTAVDEATPQFISGVRSLDEYDAYLETLRSFNIDRAVEIVQEAYDAFMAR